MEDDLRNGVKEYYGKTLKISDDINTTACSLNEAIKRPKHVSEAMKLIHDDVHSKYYGCGLVVPEYLEGMKMLDLGCGSGRDCYALAKLVGKDGFVTGIDMTDEQLETANQYMDYHQKAFRYQKPNLKFVKGYIENLGDAGIEDNSIDIIISNCVINLCKDKKTVLQEAYRVLKDGGELFFSDMYTDRVLSEEVRRDKVLWGEGLGGALHWKELFSIAKEIGFEMPKTVSARMINVIKKELQESVGDSKYASVLYRLFKLPVTVKRENSQVIYNGSITGYENQIQFDKHLKFLKDTPVFVDGDTAAFLSSSRFEKAFKMMKSECCTNMIKSELIDPFVLAACSLNQSSADGCSAGSKCE